jgi:hypothetical protein
VGEHKTVTPASPDHGVPWFVVATLAEADRLCTVTDVIAIAKVITSARTTNLERFLVPRNDDMLPLSEDLVKRI